MNFERDFIHTAAVLREAELEIIGERFGNCLRRVLKFIGGNFLCEELFGLVELLAELAEMLRVSFRALPAPAGAELIHELLGLDEKTLRVMIFQRHGDRAVVNARCLVFLRHQGDEFQQQPLLPRDFLRGEQIRQARFELRAPARIGRGKLFPVAGLRESHKLISRRRSALGGVRDF